MIPRKKLCIPLALAAIFMIATYSIQSRHFLSLAFSLPSVASRQESGLEHTASHIDRSPDLSKTSTPAKVSQSDSKKKLVEKDSQRHGDASSLRSCGCHDSCISELRTSTWFSQRYDSKQEPVLRDTISNFDHNALTWWLGLQQSKSDVTLEKVMSDMFKVISPPSEDFKPLPSRCRTCAVVGNSGNLQKSSYGNLIDSHNSVIRMNKAVTRGFEHDVGQRTTHHFQYPESALDVGPGVSLVLLPFKLRDLEWLTSALSTGEIIMTYMRVKERVEADKDKVLVINPVFMKYVHDRWTEQHGRYPSTGMMAIIFALHTCDQVSVFGYGADKLGNWHHYWEENRNAGAFRKTGVHNADFETEVIRQLAKEGKISLHQ